MQRSTLIGLPSLSYLLMYNMSTSLFGCNTPYIAIVFLDFLSTSFNSLSFQCNIPASYLNIATAHAFIDVILFPTFSFDFGTNQNLHLYSFIVFYLISFSLILSNLTIPKHVYPSLPTSFITSLIGSFIPSHLTTFTFFMARIPHFFIPNSIPISELKT